MYNNNIELEIRVNGRPVRIYNHEGRIFAESRENTEYTIWIKNNNWYRVLAVPAIDGISTIDGGKASHNSGGYIIGGYQSYEIKGFRKDLDTVGAFRFTKKNSGYAAYKGDTTNVGIISVAVFKEKQPIVFTNNIQPNLNFDNDWDLSFVKLKNCSNNLGIPVSQNNIFYTCFSTTSVKPTEETFDHSTNWGSKVQDRVISGTFEKESLLAQFDIYYASKDGLKTLGIDVAPKKEVAFPQGFNTFCEPPKGW